MTALANTDITVTVIDRKWYGKQHQNLVKLTFGNAALTYPSGGVAFPSAASLGLKSPLKFLQILDDVGTDGINWKPDYANSKLRAYSTGHIPYVVVNETVTLASNAGTLKYPPALIITGTGTISAAQAALKMVPASATAGAGEVQIEMTTGAITCHSGITVPIFSYIPRQPAGPFSAANCVEESITLATGNNDLTYQAAAINFAYQTTATAARLTWAHANASGKLALDIVNSSATTVSANSAQNSKAVKFNYLKLSGFANNSAIVALDQATYTLGSEAIEWGKTAGDRVGGWMIPALGGQLITFHDSSTYDEAYMCNESGTPANTLSTFNVQTQVLTTAQTGDSETLTDLPMLYMHPFLSSLRNYREMTVNDAPAATTLYAIAYA